MFSLRSCCSPRGRSLPAWASLPAHGGPYLYARAAFGARAAFAVGWTAYATALFSTSTVIVGLVESVAIRSSSTSPSDPLVIELALVTTLTTALSFGLRLSAIAWSSITVLKSLPLLALPIAALASALARDPRLHRRHRSRALWQPP